MNQEERKFTIDPGWVESSKDASRNAKQKIIELRKKIKTFRGVHLKCIQLIMERQNTFRLANHK